MCETLQPVWQQTVELLWSQTKQTSQMNTFKPLQAFFPFDARLSPTEKLLGVDRFSAAVTCLKGSVPRSRRLFHCDCYYLCWDIEPSSPQWFNSGPTAPAVAPLPSTDLDSERKGPAKNTAKGEYESGTPSVTLRPSQMFLCAGSDYAVIPENR